MKKGWATPCVGACSKEPSKIVVFYKAFSCFDILSFFIFQNLFSIFAWLLGATSYFSAFLLGFYLDFTWIMLGFYLDLKIVFTKKSIRIKKKNVILHFLFCHCWFKR